MRRTFVLILMIILVLAGPLTGAKEAALQSGEAGEGWILLFDGESTFGLLQDGSSFRVSDGVLMADGAGPAYIRTTSPFSDFLLKLDFRAFSTGADAAIFIRTANDAVPTENGYQIRLGDSDSNWPAGSVVLRKAASGPHLMANQWHTMEISALGDHITVTVDHQKVTDVKDPSARAGFIGFKVAKGGRLEFRDVKLKPAATTSLFNGSDLNGWKTGTEQTPPAKPGKIKKMLHMGGGAKGKEADWSVRDHAIHGEKGPGQLTSGAMYEDYVLQFETRSAPGKPQGAIYLRGEADKMFSGYMVQLDENAPGAIVPNLASPRRKVRLTNITVTTVAVHGRHIAVWVNGFPVTEFSDTRPEGSPTEKNAKTGAGVIALPLQSSSATANYSQIKLSLLSKTLGGVIGKAAPPAPAPVVAATPVAPVTPQQQADNTRVVGGLMGTAVMSKDPEEQKRLYSE